MIQALGFGDERAHSAIRISLGRFTNDDEINTAVDKIVDAVRQLHSINQRLAAG